jgi:DNA-directed RNA polymerase subunit RPC12/RpoP
MAEYTVLARSDLLLFDKESTALVMEMTSAGWTGRLSSGQHAIMLAPDGETTASVTRSSLRGRSGRNARSVFTRWQRQQRQLAAQEEEEMAEVVQYRCAECGRTFGTERSLGSHSKVHRNQAVECPLCHAQVKYMDTHLRRVHGHPKSAADLIEGAAELLLEAAVIIRETES